MKIEQVLRIYETIKHLKFIQIYYRLYYFFRNKLYKKKHVFKGDLKPISFLNTYNYKTPETFLNNSFTFLNLAQTFDSSIDWNFSGYGKLWTYNLNYFDFLNQSTITKEEGLLLIENYLLNETKLKDGLEPYPISLRTINWIKFISKNEIKKETINKTLYCHYKQLCFNLEFHLLGNHLLENAFALLFGAYFFKDEKLYRKAKKILENELKEQILEDGGHFELSPMYHQIILYKVLDSIYIIQKNKWKTDDLLDFLIKKAEKMLSFLKLITYRNGNIPMVNDSAYNIAPSTESLLEFANTLKIEVKALKQLTSSGYRKISSNTYELIYDVGSVGPKYQPGHAHSDTFNFELYYNNKPFIVDRGISTYEKNKKRHSERSTVSHNTVMVNAVEQTDVWGGFRVASRAKIVALKESENEIKATHNGYKKIGARHQRTLKYFDNEISIEDEVFGKKKTVNQAFLHFHPDIQNVTINSNVISFGDLDITIIFDENCKSLTSEKYEYCLGFNKTKEAIKICATFERNMIVKIKM